jgi:hypothetical protein
VKAAYEKVTLKGKTGGWESALDPEEEGDFRGLLRDKDELRNIRFLRCIVPLEGQFKNPLFMVFGDGSREAFCSLVYLQWKRDDSKVVCRHREDTSGSEV